VAGAPDGSRLEVLPYAEVAEGITHPLVLPGSPSREVDRLLLITPEEDRECDREQGHDGS
jgi:hypothetical protein